MNVHIGRRLFLTAAVVGAVAVSAMGFFVALGGRSVVAGPGSAPPAAAPTPVGHEWSQVEGHGTGTGAWWLGTSGSDALELRAGGSRALRLEPGPAPYDGPNLIGGYSGNSVTAGVMGAAIGGGGSSGNTNRVTDDYGTVAGGQKNQADHNASVGGGYSNTASGHSSTVSGGTNNTANAEYATVSGGENNTAGFYAAVGGGESNIASAGSATVGGGQNNTAAGLGATVGGGAYNTASGTTATVGGGDSNTASGSLASVPGGLYNTAQGDYSFAAGRRAKANNNGCFVWGDATDADVACDSNNGFVVRASGNMWFGTTSSPDLTTGFINTSTGAYLSSAGVWTDNSDRDAKENFTPVDGQEVLASLAEMPITTWNYKAQEPSIRHMGPVGQDFYAAFGLGEDESHIAGLDSSGVALAAIQGLYQLSQEQAGRIQALEVENARLQQRVDGLDTRLTALEGRASTSGAAAGPLSGLSAGWLLLGGLVVVGLALVQRRRAGGRP